MPVQWPRQQLVMPVCRRCCGCISGMSSAIHFGFPRCGERASMRMLLMKSHETIEEVQTWRRHCQPWKIYKMPPHLQLLFVLWDQLSLPRGKHLHVSKRDRQIFWQYCFLSIPFLSPSGGWVCRSYCWNLDYWVELPEGSHVSTFTIAWNSITWGMCILDVVQGGCVLELLGNLVASFISSSEGWVRWAHGTIVSELFVASRWKFSFSGHRFIDLKKLNNYFPDLCFNNFSVHIWCTQVQKWLCSVWPPDFCRTSGWCCYRSSCTLTCGSCPGESCGLH